ncbi:hypothetical protein ES705_23567 [subsurface metagenome]
MINIITIDFSKIRGPGKVVNNLIKGLDEIKYPYVINKDINATKRCYIPNRLLALLKLQKAKSKVIVGPNLFVLPDEIPSYVKLRDTIYLQPSQWTLELWNMLGFNRALLKVWPTGIDTDSFYPVHQSNKKITIYNKKRSIHELEQVETTLQQMGLDYHKVIYGNYDEQEYRNILKSTSFIIWHGCHESQGIALQEALASGVPVLVLDVKSLFEQVPCPRLPSRIRAFEVTSAPYFDNRCGIKTKDINTLRQSIEFMMDNLKSFRPREFILENLSLAKQANELVKLYEHYGLSTEDGYDEKPMSNNEYSDGIVGKIIHMFITLRKLL